MLREVLYRIDIIRVNINKRGGKVEGRIQMRCRKKDLKECFS